MLYMEVAVIVADVINVSIVLVCALDEVGRCGGLLDMGIGTAGIIG